ncbi:otoancorin [Paramisgurnus dabryanus]|uniref:otoancorin n=1 Tax=Paramisgurnus dabryanus TaxID=90735 RepID=UPI0031F41EA3
MMSLWGILILCFLAQWDAVMSEDMMPPDIQNRNQSTVCFPRLPLDFKEMAKKLMLACSKKGYRVPIIDFSQNSSYTLRENLTMGNPFFAFAELLSSLSPPVLKPNATTEDRKIAEKMRNCSSLGQMIELMRNTTDVNLCFMRAFLSPLAWTVITQNGTDLDQNNLMKLLWAAKPFLETMPPSNFVLPPISQSSQLGAMMKMFGDMFNGLSDDQRNEIIGWMKERVGESKFNCISNLPPQKPPNGTGPTPPCPPKIQWLNSDVLPMMGPFLSRMPLEEVNSIPKEALCAFFSSPNFSLSFRNVGGIQPSLGRALLQRLKQECSSADSFPQQVERLGSLACYFDGFQSLNANLSKKLLSQLDTCDNSDIAKVKSQLVQNIIQNAPPSREILQSLGSAVSVLTPSKLSGFTPDDLKNTLANLSQANWNPAQAKTLAKKLLDETKNISSEKLLSLGSVVRGVSSDVLRNAKAQGLLGNEALKNISEKMSSLQKRALLEAFRHDVNASELVKEVPDSLLRSLSLSTLDKANLTSVDQLDGHSWTRAQSAFLVKKILGNKLNLTALRKLGQAVQGVSCEMIEKINRTDALEMVQVLDESFDWLSRVQIRCAAQKLFASLEEQRPGYFNEITKSELQAIPAILLIQLPVEKIQNLSDSVCTTFLEKMRQANLSSLPNNAPSRLALTRRAIKCLGPNVPDLSAAAILSLGPLVCELEPAWISSLNPKALNETLQALASCQQIPQQNREQLFGLLTKTYGDPSNWSEDDMRTLGPLLLLNDNAVRSLPFKSWLVSSLSDLMNSLPIQPMGSPKEFRNWFDISALRRKLFELKTASPPQSRRKRGVISALSVPTLAVIEDLGPGNVYWTAVQLSNMTTQTFREALPILGGIANYTAEQLSVFRAKALEVWGSVSMLNDSQIGELGCISQSFSSEEFCNVSISTLDTLELLNTCNFTQPQRAGVWQAFQKGTGKNVTDLGEISLVGLGQFICGLKPALIDQLNSTAFREAVEVVGRAPCPLNIIERLKEKAVAVFGKPETWTEAQAGIMGNIIAGLSAAEFGSLSSTALPFIQSFAIPLITPDRLAMLSANQLKALGPDNAAMITDAQRGGLRPEQNTALDEAIGVPAQRDSGSTVPPAPQPQTGGVPAMDSMAGYMVLMQVIMLMLCGFFGLGD